MKMGISCLSISFFFASTIFLLLCSSDLETVESSSRRLYTKDSLYYFNFHNTLIHEKALNRHPSPITPPPIEPSLPPLEFNLRRKPIPTTFGASSPSPLPLPRLYQPWPSVTPTTLGMDFRLSQLPLQRLHHQPWPSVTPKTLRTDSPSPLRLPRLYLSWTSVTPTTQGTESPLSPLPLQRLYQQPWPSVTETFGRLISSRILSQQQSSTSSSELVPDGSESESGSGSRVVVITGLSVALFVFLAIGVSFICYNRRRHDGTGGRYNYRNNYANGRDRGAVTDVPHEVSLTVMSNPPSKNAPSVKSATLYYSPATASPAKVTDPENPSPQPSSTTVHDFGLKVFKYRELLKATDDFSKTNCLGEGGFGAVFKGVLPDNTISAVKVLKNENFKGDSDFRTEVNAISRAIHKHIVSLIGYCIHADKRLIVFEFVANNSLHHYLHGGVEVQVLDWAKRVKIALGTAKGLVYLHEDCPRKIIHRDVKPANILLDFNFEAKVADFGIAKLCPDSFDSHLFTGPVGTRGYVDPEYFHTGILTVKSDVYSFGVVLLELVSGCRPPTVHELVIKLPKALKKRNFDTLADPRLQKIYNTREMTLMVACADACLRKEAKDRPLMKQIAHVLEGITSPAELKKGNKGESCF